jgi:hypothetical protein
MMRRLVLFVFLLFTITGGFLYPEDGDFSLNAHAGTEKMFGYTLYSIGWNVYDRAGNKYPLGYKLSELFFPLDYYFVYGTVDVRFLKSWAAGLGFAKSVFAPSGTMEDSDWGIWYYEGNSWAESSTLDIFSESDSNILNAYTADADVRYILTIQPGLEVSAGIGFIYEYYYFETSDLDQWYPSYDTYSAYIEPEYSQHVYVTGPLLTYEARYLIPLVEAGIHITLFDSLVMNLVAGYSPFVKVFDADDHILRSKLSHGDCTGMAAKCTFNGHYRFAGIFFAGWNADFMYIGAEGKQTQMLYNDTGEGPAGPLGSIDMKIGSLRFAAGIFFGATF